MKPIPGRTDVSDQSILDHLRRKGEATVGDLVELLGVTATAVRQRLTRLMDNGLVARQAEAAGRGRPMHRYSLTPTGERSGGNNYDQLAQVLWDEVRAVKDPDIRQGLLSRLSHRLAEVYRSQVEGSALPERMASLASLMAQQDLRFVFERTNELPVLTALACPYPDLAERDRGVCAMEKMMISEVLGEGVRLSACRLDGATCCTFEASAAPAGA
jgi:DeoR family transcriptional regulator, suf operon transcriptional repressor